MKQSEYLAEDATGLADLIGRGEVSESEVLEAAIARAEQVNGKLNAIALPLYEQARAAMPDRDQGPFRGVPFLVKDYGQAIAGVPDTAGSRAFRQRVADRDSEYVTRCRKAGLRIFGRTTTPELALKSVTESALWGATRNPWDLSRSPGGSSGGSGAAVAAGIVPMAGASDGGGSIRIPAGHNGLVGLKPSRGRVSGGPFKDEGWMGASTDMVLSRSVRDSAAMLDVLAGAASGDPFVIAQGNVSFAEQSKIEPGKLRIGYFTDSPYGSKVDGDCSVAVEKAVKLLQDLGHEVEPARPGFNGSALAHAFLNMYFAEVACAMNEARAMGRSDSDFELQTRILGVLGRSVSAAEFVASRHGWNDFSRSLGQYFKQYDLYLCPSTGQIAPKIGALDMSLWIRMASRLLVHLRAGKAMLASGIVDTLAKDGLAPAPFTQLANLSGTPAISVPLHWNESGLPVGVQFGAAFGQEGLLLGLARQLETAQPWWSRYEAAESCA